MENKDGVWRTIRGRRVFIRKGESLGSAMSRSGKFKRADIRTAKQKLSMDSTINNMGKVGKDTEKGNKYARKFLRKEKARNYESKNQAEKNKIHEYAPTHHDAKTRVDRNYEHYSKEQQKELRHEELQKKLADFKAKKQSNNKDVWQKRKEELLSGKNQESERELYERAKNNPDSIDPMTENSTDWEALEKKYGNNKIDIKNNNGELTGYTDNERIEYHHSGDTGLMASVYSTGEDDLLQGHFFNIPKEYQEGDKLKEYSLKEVERLKSDRKAYLQRQEAGIPEESKYKNQIKVKGDKNIIPRDFTKAYGRFKVETSGSKNLDDRYEITKDDTGWHAKNLRTGETYATFREHLSNNNVFEFESDKNETIKRYKQRKGK